MKRSTVLIFLVALGTVVLSVSCSKKASASGGSARSARARTPNPRTDFAYELNEAGDGVVITKYVGTGSTTVVIPDTIEDFPVVGIGDGAFYYARTGVDSGHKIWNSYLSRWSSASKPFDYVYVPRTVTYVGKHAFYAPREKIEDGSYYFQGIQELDIDISNIKSLGSGATENFAYTKFSDTDIVIPAGWELSFGDSSNYGIFAGTNVTSVTFSEGCEKIQRQMFSGCSELKKVTIPESLKEIGDGAFSYCTKLEEVNFSEGSTIKYPNGLLETNESFIGCSALPLGVRAKIQASGYKDEF